MDLVEAPRLLRRLQLLRGWNFEQANKFSPEVREKQSTSRN
jgi:hypothetical protein